MAKEIQPFNCPMCGALLTGQCFKCTAFYEGKQSIKPTSAGYMTGDERAAEMKKFEGPLSIPFPLLHKRMELLVGRPILTHEFGLNFEGLIEEARTGIRPTLEEVLDLIPEEKRIIIER